jgi:hypothetical protein
MLAIRGIERRRSPADSCSITTDGRISNVANVAAASPPMTARPSGDLLADSPIPGPSGTCRDHKAGHENGADALRAPSAAAASAVCPASRAVRRMSQKIALATATPMAIIAP